MPLITLPDGAQRTFPEPLTAQALAESIGAGLARSALAAKIDDRLGDLSTIITDDCRVALITERDPEGLQLLRHSCAHLLAMAVKQLYPAAQVTIGPNVDDGFFYDFAFERPFTPDDLAQIEARMKALVGQDIPLQRSEMPRDEAIALFESLGERYKCEIIRDLPSDAVISLYRQGEFIDLCRGPHVPSTGRIKAFKLMKLAGAYWRGDSRNAMLQRIYGTCWPDDKSLTAHLTRLEEAGKRDHRKLGVQLDLFHFDDCAPGSIFWHSKGWTLFLQLLTYMRQRQQDAG